MPNRMALDALRAFDRELDGTWTQTPETQKVLGIIRDSGGRDFKIQPAPSPMAGLGGEGIWGTGGGVHRPAFGDTYVDPVNGSVSTAAHEAGHASFPTQLVNTQNRNEALNRMQNYNDAASPGNRLRTVYETLSKPVLLEEANAQGVARAAMDKAGYTWNNSGWEGLPMEKTGLNSDIRPELAYPAEYRFGGEYDKGAKLYSNVEQIGLGPVKRGMTQEEKDALKMTQNSLVPAMERQFKEGYSLIKQKN